MKVAELRKALDARGLSTKGLKAVLVLRLDDALDAAALAADAPNSRPKAAHEYQPSSLIIGRARIAMDRLKGLVGAKLESLLDEKDDNLTEYVMVMVSNKKSLKHIVNSLEEVVDKETAEQFGGWFEGVLEAEAKSSGADEGGATSAAQPKGQDVRPPMSGAQRRERTERLGAPSRAFQSALAGIGRRGGGD